nr:MAG TPA: hypothetical protein [Caudoviricetes sp.]
MFLVGRIYSVILLSKWGPLNLIKLEYRLLLGLR